MALGPNGKQPRPWEERLNDREFPILDTLKASAVFGAYTGGAGLVACSVKGILQSSHPVVTALAGGIHYTGLGMSYAACRQSLLYTYKNDEKALPYISAAAGSVCGAAVTALTRSRAQALPAAVVWGAVGFGGQKALEYYQRRSQNAPNTQSRSIWDMKWSPLQRLADDDYEVLLKEQLLRIDARLAIVEEDLVKFRSELSTEQSKQS